MKTSIDAYIRVLESRARFYINRAKDDHDRNYPAALANCRVVGDFTGEDRWDVYDRIQHAMDEAEAAAA